MAHAQERTIVIVGGVAAGASAAVRARRMNEKARIILYEKDRHVSFANCGLPYHIGGEIQQRGKLLVATPELFSKRFNIEVHTRCEVTGIDRRRKVISGVDRDSGTPFEQTYDKLILAPGASPVVPPIAGVNASNVFTLRNLEDADRIGAFLDQHAPRRAVVIGAGFIGLEMVEMLAARSLDVSLVEMLGQVLPPFDPEMAHIIQTELHSKGVALHLGNGLAGFEVRDGRMTHVVLQDGTALAGDLAILSIGVRPNIALAQAAGLTIGASGGIAVDAHLRTSDPDIYAAGDAVEYCHTVADRLMRTPLAGPANRAGRLAGEHAATDRSAAMGCVLGTAIVRVFDVTAALTGCTSRMAARDGNATHVSYIRANHHAGYYPGAQPMTIKLLCDPGTRKILGAQIVGGAGVDKRIDVIAALIQSQATVDDLTHLDLAYAPPFGSAKDPLHMAGFVATNELDGLVHTLPPGAPLDGQQVIDLRTQKEVADVPLARAPRVMHIPIDELRGRLAELDRSRPTVTVCASGLRSYVAARMLMQHGFDHVSSLAGGALMRVHAVAAGAGG